jgi:Na+-translocating membrane potential-generating system (MpsC)
MSDAGPDDRALRPLAGGRLLAEITNRIVAFMREHYGRGPIKAKTYVLDNLSLRAFGRVHRDRAHDDGRRRTRASA